MASATVEVDSSPDGTIIIQPRGDLGVTEAIDLRRALVHAIRHTRPVRLVLDLRDVRELDPINLGTLAAACQLGDDHQVAVFLDHCQLTIAAHLVSAGVPRHRMRRVGMTPQSA